MKSNVASCSAWQLYVILDAAAAGGHDLVEIASAAIQGGADVVQLREKRATAKQLFRDAERVLHVTRAAGIPFIVNDRPDIACAVGADGVHLGQEDVPISVARRLLGPERIIGQSTHSLDQALAAEAEGADYLGIGPIFATPTKPDYESVGLSLISQVRARVRVPTVCIGGIDQGNLPKVLAAGGRCVAVVRAVCAAQDPQAAARGLRETFAHFLHATSSGRI